MKWKVTYDTADGVVHRDEPLGGGFIVPPEFVPLLVPWWVRAWWALKRWTRS